MEKEVQELRKKVAELEQKLSVNTKSDQWLDTIQIKAGFCIIKEFYENVIILSLLVVWLGLLLGTPFVSKRRFKLIQFISPTQAFRCSWT